MKNKDGVKKNISVVQQEFRNWSQAIKENTMRFQYGSLINKGSRSPSGDTNNNYGHLLINYVSTTYQELPRTLTYITLLVFAVSLLEITLNVGT